MIYDVSIFENSTIINAIEKMDKTGHGIVCILNESNKLTGIITDGDIRRSILNGVSSNLPVTEIMNRDYTSWTNDQSREAAINYLRRINRRHLPIINEKRELVDLILLDFDNYQKYDNPVILMVGGLGTRLKPLTDDCPKPLLKVGNKPILETIIEKFMASGFHNFYLSVNYKSKMIKDYFGDGSQLGISIKYIHEEKRMGTAGALSLLPDKPDDSIVIMNGDLLTNVNFKELIEFHKEHNTHATMGVREHEYQVPYGVVEVVDNKIESIVEKPINRYFVNAGIYVIEPEVLKLIPNDTFFDMPTLFEKIKLEKFHSSAFPVREYWCDIGKPSDYEKANKDYNNVF